MSRRRLDKTYSGVFETSELNMRETLPQEDRLFIATRLSCDLPAGFQILRIQDPES